MEFKPEEEIAYEGREWGLFKAYLLKQQEYKVRMLVAESTHDKSNQIRGALAMIQQILGLEKAASLAAQRDN